MLERHKILSKAISEAMEGILPINQTSLSEWANEHFSLPPEGSRSTGKWTSYPFQVGWMDAFSNDNITEVAVQKSRRVGYTKTLIAFMAYNVICRHRNQAAWWPTEEDRNRFVRTELDPTIKDVKALQDRVITHAGKTSSKIKQFVGSTLNVLGGRTPRAYRGLTIDVGLLDEISAFDETVGDEIPPIEAVKGRLEGAPFPKLIVGSTPRTKEKDHIGAAVNSMQAVMQYNILCPHCKKWHILRFGNKESAYGFKWTAKSDGGYNVFHVCPMCQKSITQQQYLSIYGDGKWISVKGSYIYGNDKVWRDFNGNEIKPPETVAFSIWAGYSPQRTWENIVREFIFAKERAAIGDVGKLKLFVNETLGESWEPVFEGANEHVLAQRAEDYARYSVPEGGIFLVSGIDVQGDRWEAVTYAYGRGDEMWCVDYSVLYGDPNSINSWVNVLDTYLDRDFIHENGTIMKIRAAAIDMMGHFTQIGYQYCLSRQNRGVYGVQGTVIDHGFRISLGGRRQEFSIPGMRLSNMVSLWRVNTKAAKDLLFNKLKVTTPGKNYIHFYKGLPSSFFDGLTAEKRIRRRTKRGEVFAWTNIFERPNEPLDCTVYSMFLADTFHLSYKTEKQWKELENELFHSNKKENVVKSGKTDDDGPIKPIRNNPNHSSPINPWSDLTW